MFLFYGGDGNDTAVVTATGLNTLLDGGAGNDSLTGSPSGTNISPSGTNILVGGPGNDTLIAGDNRDLLIGGLGIDLLRANAGDDILIGGTTDHDQNAIALKAIMAEWRRTDADYVTRVHHLDGSLTGGLNGPFFLNAATVHDDGKADQLFGGDGTDWFFAALNDEVHSQLGEIVTPIS